MGWQARIATGRRILRVGLTLLLAAAAWGHEIPTEVLARAVGRARGQTFQLVMRVPLDSMRDAEVPEFGPGYLDIERLAPQLPALATQWVVPFVEFYENGEKRPARLAATQISLPSDGSLASVDLAVEHVASGLPANSEHLVWDQVQFDILLEFAIDSAQSDFMIRPRLAHLGDRVTAVLSFELPGGVIRSYQLAGDAQPVPLDPRWSQAAWRFVRLGFLHILDGSDHLLFLLCLVVPLRRLKPLALIVTAFTLAHSVTLIASALGLAPDAQWFPPFVELLIAVSIVYMALENIVGASRRRVVMAFGFGLVHGFGFSFVLRETLQFAGSHLLTSLVAFNVGVEIGQLAVLLALVPALSGLFRWVAPERLGAILVSAFAAHHAWHWSLERWAVVALYDLQWIPLLLAGLGCAALAASGKALVRGVPSLRQDGFLSGVFRRRSARPVSSGGGGDRR